MSEVAEFKWGEIAEFPPFKVAKSKSPQIADLTWALKVSVTAPRTPPPSKRRIIYQSPNQDHLRNALLEGGSSYSQLSGQGPNSPSEQIQFFAINDCSLNDLLADRRFQGFVCDPANACLGSLVIEAGNYRIRYDENRSG
ncbi:hypothetical protein R3P38DRAFT_2768520 [Favolaschia claudopus]|uniref:Uncharacterized protein n=1 Tax=Favolaschia claudopus TaxID=2862362 RepID=A0AAW0CR21_9AGAR